MKYDDKIRSRFGVTVCLRDMGNGKSRLFFDDVIADKDENPITWTYEYFCTYTPELDDNDLDMMKLTDSKIQGHHTYFCLTYHAEESNFLPCHE